MKRIAFFLMSIMLTTALLAEHHPLTDPILRDIDGLPGVFDKTKIQNTLWLIREIKNTHAGLIKIDSNGLPNPRAGKSHQLLFKGEKQTIKTLIDLEKRKETMSLEDQEELNELFHAIKGYFGIVNEMMLADARGTQEFMVKLIREFCRKNNRQSSILLNWDKGTSETEMYEHDITSFSIYYVFSTDLMNFLAALIKSCPKAFASFKAASIKKV